MKAIWDDKNVGYKYVGEVGISGTILLNNS